ncbi:phosphoribosylaminoimidazolesuccinocarboxamide synthase [Stratiformator vulcanicus]|uniref:Phosphoribosylaminoimidazole-succinocarboxamide synthase n=1 Tax=Stratiformator vulcanicus TaxID=2527980 RepID=A0A517R4P2_9PLAN|nr:phosphoribosylaminoimidazolesuccinocarboxamide synthase [Stratiformator vulcanicus]QDT38846.1 Phosphoribosylaminoimidazole-succinocarboxamide synthase [Stratiformator vulcanicus]
MPRSLLHSELPGLQPRRGKVRDVYDFGDRLLIVATDRISAFDWVLPNAVPEKGRILTAISQWWFAQVDCPHHLLSTDPSDVSLPSGTDVDALRGRSMVVRKTDVVPIECVARGYLAGSGWKEYCQSRSVCDVALPDGLSESDLLPQPIFTPATKAEEGHDENISFEEMCRLVGADLADKLRGLTLDLYQFAQERAAERGIIIADTKFEFGRLPDGSVILIDEVLTPDSSRFWPAEEYRPGGPQVSFDKQYVRDWLSSCGWDKNSPPPPMPEDVIAGTVNRYREAFERLTGHPFSTSNA